MDSSRFATGNDLNCEEVADKLRDIADAMDDGDLMTSNVESVQKAPGGDMAEFELRITYCSTIGSTDLGKVVNFEDEQTALFSDSDDS